MSKTPSVTDSDTLRVKGLVRVLQFIIVLSELGWEKITLLYEPQIHAVMPSLDSHLGRDFWAWNKTPPTYINGSRAPNLRFTLIHALIRRDIS